MDEVAIRSAVPADAAALTALHLDVWDDAYTGLIAQSILDERRERVAERVERRRHLKSAESALLLISNADSAGISQRGSSRPRRRSTG